jgi:hypothetical protein
LPSASIDIGQKKAGKIAGIGNAGTTGTGTALLGGVSPEQFTCGKFILWNAGGRRACWSVLHPDHFKRQSKLVLQLEIEQGIFDQYQNPPHWRLIG